jgi:threonine/homoserine/homoserine lactone efflux protein
MSLEVWIAYLAASAVLLAIPGPTVMLVVSYALGRGRDSAWATVPGVALGDLTAMTVSMIGAGTVLAASASLFTVLKLCGAGYLVWLGVGLWRTRPEKLQIDGGPRRPADRRRMFWNAYAVTALNPKSIVFFIAFVPQFLVPDAPLTPQFVILIATFVGLAAVNTLLWAVLAGEMRRRFERPVTLKLIHRTAGSFLIGAGLATALARQSG